MFLPQSRGTSSCVGEIHHSLYGSSVAVAFNIRLLQYHCRGKHSVVNFPLHDWPRELVCHIIVESNLSNLAYNHYWVLRSEGVSLSLSVVVSRSDRKARTFLLYSEAFSTCGTCAAFLMTTTCAFSPMCCLSW